MTLSFKQFLVEAKIKESEYQDFFKKTLEEFGVESPAELDDEKKKEFFNYIEKNWTKDKE